jgi:hypothetical protein
VRDASLEPHHNPHTTYKDHLEGGQLLGREPLGQFAAHEVRVLHQRPLFRATTTVTAQRLPPAPSSPTERLARCMTSCNISVNNADVEEQRREQDH